jgi:hypothetical protein
MRDEREVVRLLAVVAAEERAARGAAGHDVLNSMVPNSGKLFMKRFRDRCLMFFPCTNGPDTALS